MGIYSETCNISTGPMPTAEDYGSKRDLVRWGMMSADCRARFYTPDRADAFLMDHLTATRGDRERARAIKRKNIAANKPKHRG